MKALILVGGEGTRLRPLTNTMPKPMVPIDGKPFLQYLIEWLKKEEITEIILLIGYKGDQIKAYFGDGSKFGVKIEYILEETLLGTGGAIKNAEHLIKGTCIALNGDSFFPINLKKLIMFHQEKKAEATLALARVKDTKRYGLVVTDKDHHVKQFLEKGNPIEGVDTINAGIYVLEESVIKSIPQGKVSIEKEVFPKIKALYGLPLDAYFIDIGTHETYAQFQADMHKVIK